MIVASFASHIHRIQQAITIAHLHGRKFALSGRSMVKNANIARNLGYLKVPEGAMIKLTQIDDYRPEEILILSTGSQGEPLSALTRMAFNDHPQVELHEGDTVVISAKAIPGNERSVTATIDRLLKVGATVIYGERSGIHVSGHAAQEDLKMMLNLTRPRFLVPVHGEYRMQHMHAELARQSGIPDEDIFILENGDVLELEADNGEIVDKVATGMVFVDGSEIGDPEGLVLRDRQQLAADGILIAVVTVDAQTGASVAAARARRPRIPPRRRTSQGHPRRVRRGPRRSDGRARRRARHRPAPDPGGHHPATRGAGLPAHQEPAADHARRRRGLRPGAD